MAEATRPSEPGRSGTRRRILANTSRPPGRPVGIVAAELRRTSPVASPFEVPVAFHVGSGQMSDPFPFPATRFLRMILAGERSSRNAGGTVLS
jgi:hypothetical protein